MVIYVEDSVRLWSFPVIHGLLDGLLTCAFLKYRQHKYLKQSWIGKIYLLSGNLSSWEHLACLMHAGYISVGSFLSKNKILV